MKKEKKVRTYQRRTKSGKTVTVRAHTASYEAAEKAKEAAKKKGAGDELSDRKSKKDESWKLPMDEFLKKLKEDNDRKKWDESIKWESDEKPKKKTTKKRSVGTGTNGPEPKKKETKKTTAKKTAETSEPAFTAAEFKEWYRGTGSASDKKVAKALRKQLGRSGYRKFEDEAIDNYTSRGHLKMFKRVSSGGESSTPTKVTKSGVKAAPKADKLPKVGESVKLSNWLDGSKGKKQSYQVVAVQNATKQAKENSGLQHWLWVKDKKGNIYAATHEEDGKIGIDSTWQDFTDSKMHPYASSLKKAGYGLRKASGKGGEYWEVVSSKSKALNSGKKTSTKANKSSTKETSADLRNRADQMDADEKRATIEKKLGSKRFRTIKGININVVRPNTRTAQLKGTLYVSSDRTKVYYEGSDGKLKKATKSILDRYVNKTSSNSEKRTSTKIPSK